MQTLDSMSRLLQTPLKGLVFLYIQGHCQYKVLMILIRRTSAQRELIKIKYSSLTGKPLIESTVCEFFGHQKYLALCLLHTGPDADAFILRRSTRCFSRDYTILVHLCVSRSSEQISLVKESYFKMYKQQLSKRIRLSTFGKYKQMLTYLIEKPRSVAPGDPALAAKQAKLFYSQFGISVFTYLDRYSGKYEFTLLSICRYALDPLKYYAGYLKRSILNGRFRDVICIIATRCEIDLASIFAKYRLLFNSSPKKEINEMFQHKFPTIVFALNRLMGEN
ncbi:Annexin A13 [Thelohanellus kitauei]|uniref:Annexin A13 n=1 Tax=Thelohanellus kitauei TaxID=669202 RepID=A0A0C2N5J8_THEKT|nr:Annexin A13 [Thelohanellus kitauei]